MNEYFGEQIYLSKIFENIQISDYMPKIVFDYLGNFHISVYFGHIFTHFGPIITVFNNFWETLKIQMYSLSYILDDRISKYIRQ